MSSAPKPFLPYGRQTISEADIAAKVEVPEDMLSLVHLAVIRLQLATAEQNRQVFESLRATGIDVQMHNSPVPLQPYYLAMSFGERQFPEVESYASSTNSMWLFQDRYNAAYLRVLMILSKQVRSLTPEVAT